MTSAASDVSALCKSLFITEQTAPAPTMQEAVATFPPLDRVTVVGDGNLTVRALLAVSPSAPPDQSWDVRLWYSADGSEWTDLKLEASDAVSALSLSSLPRAAKRLYFSASLRVQDRCFFTVKYKGQHGSGWQWARDLQGASDATVVVKPQGVESARSSDQTLPDLISGLNPAWDISSAVSQSPGTSVWTMKAPVGPSRDNSSHLEDVSLGVPFGGFLRWFALVRIWPPWIAPRHGRETFRLDKPAVLSAFLSRRGSHMVVLGLSGTDDVMTLIRSGQDGQVVVNARNDSESPSFATLIVSVGEAFPNAVAAAMYQARDMVHRAKAASDELQKEVAAYQDGFQAEWMRNWYDGLGFCTWNALGQRLTDKKVFDALDKLAENDIHVTTLIIDDNWQSIDYRGHGQFQHGWLDFEAEPEAFPMGLKGTVEHIRKRHPTIRHVAVWHAMLGYWAGLSPRGKLAQTYGTVEVVREDADRRNLPMGGKMTVVARHDVRRFYDDFYSFLSSCGVDAVKTDAQFMMDTWVDAAARRTLTGEYLDAWTVSSLRYFGARAISCMSQSPQIVFRSQLPAGRPPVLCRNSDDFFPEVPASHPWHVWANAHNSLMTAHLNVLPDWDMFQTVHDYSAFHAAARCVSGGPIYVTDVPGEHNMDLIAQMTGRTPRGHTVIFRPSHVAKSVDAYTGYHDKALLKVGSYHSFSSSGVGFLGIFNISSDPITELIPLSAFPGVLPGGAYIVRSHVTESISQPIRLDSPVSLINVALDVRGYDVLAAHSVFSLETSSGDTVSVANLGLLGKMTGAAAIVHDSISTLPNDRVALVAKVKALGVLGVYVSALERLSVEDHLLATMNGRPIPVSAVSRSGTNSLVLEVDLDAAWKELGLLPDYSDEVELKLYLSV